MADLNQQKKRDPRTGEVYDAGRDLDVDTLSKAKQQDASGVGSKKFVPPSAEETDPSKMSPMQRAAYDAKKKRASNGPTGFDAASALANRK